MKKTSQHLILLIAVLFIYRVETAYSQYCTATGACSALDNIAVVNVGDWSRYTGSACSSYSYFTGSGDTASITIGATTSLILNRTNPASTTSNAAVYIDWNHSGSFTD